jgi:hypothetical protein
MSVIGIYNFKDHIVGDTFNGIQFNIKINNVAADVSSGQIVFKNDGVLKSPSFSISLTVVSGGLKMEPQSIAWTPGIYSYKVLVTLSNGYIKTYVKGKFRIING